MVEVETRRARWSKTSRCTTATPQSGSQAEALRVEPAIKVILRDADFISFKNYAFTGRVYVRSYVEGQRRLHLGQGRSISTLRDQDRGSRWIRGAARNPTTSTGTCSSTPSSQPGQASPVTSSARRRDPGGGYPYSHVAYINCQMDKHIDPKGWLVTPAGRPTPRILSFGSTRAPIPQDSPST